MNLLQRLRAQFFQPTDNAGNHDGRFGSQEKFDKIVGKLGPNGLDVLERSGKPLAQARAECDAKVSGEHLSASLLAYGPRFKLPSKPVSLGAQYQYEPSVTRTPGLRDYDGRLGARQKTKVAKIAHALAERGSLTTVDIIRFRTTNPTHYGEELRRYGYVNRVTYEGPARIARYHYSGKKLVKGRAGR